MNKDSIKYGILKLKCPRCHQGDLFIYKNHYKLLTGFMKMHKSCTVCNQTFTPEPGFYFGAAYISYGIGVGISIIAFLIAFFAFHFRSMETIIPSIFIPILLLAPLNFRFSRSIWANVFIRYKKSYSNK